MLKRLSTFRKKKGGEDAGLPNGHQASSSNTNGAIPKGIDSTNGSATVNGHAEANGVNGAANGQKASKRLNVGGAAKRQWSEPDHSVTRGDVDSAFDQFAQLIHASSRPLPTQTGDGSYIEHEASSSLFQELKHLGFKDVKTLKEVIVNKASGALADDKTMLMERTIQVLHAMPFLVVHADRMQACCGASLELQASC